MASKDLIDTGNIAHAECVLVLTTMALVMQKYTAWQAQICPPGPICIRVYLHNELWERAPLSTPADNINFSCLARTYSRLHFTLFPRYTIAANFFTRETYSSEQDSSLKSRIARGLSQRQDATSCSLLEFEAPSPHGAQSAIHTRMSSPHTSLTRNGPH